MTALVCRACGADWVPVRRGECIRCGSDATPTPEPSEVAETTAGEREVEALIIAATDALMASRLTWGTHADRWGDVEWQREFWAEAASIVLTSALLERVRREEGERIAQAIEAEREAVDAEGFGWHKGCRAGLAEAATIARAASVGPSD